MMAMPSVSTRHKNSTRYWTTVGARICMFCAYVAFTLCVAAHVCSMSETVVRSQFAHSSRASAFPLEHRYGAHVIHTIGLPGGFAGHVWLKASVQYRHWSTCVLPTPSVKKLGLHDTQVVAPCTPEKVLYGHVVHCVDARSAENVPIGHGTHRPSPVSAAARMVPAGHGAHSTVALGDHQPDGHAWQCVEPEVGCMVATGHAWQLVAPALCWNLPCSQARHEELVYDAV